MIEQRVDNGVLRGWRGPALIAVVAGAVLLGSAAFNGLGRYIGRASSWLFIAYGGLIAWYLLDRYVLAFVYTCDGSCLRVRRAYGRYERPMAEAWLSSALACGSLEAMRRRFPGARVQRAVRKKCLIAPLALAYGAAGGTAILLLQPDDRLRGAILRAVKK